MSKIHIPKSHYVGIRLHEKKEDSAPLGFLVPEGNDAGAKKRKHTVDQWTKNYQNLSRWIPENDVDDFLQKNPGYFVVPNRKPYLGSVLVDKELNDGEDYKFLKDLPNTPQLGFRITRSVARYGWNGGNKVVRIEDPRGFELEISVDNLVKVMSMTTVANGVIQKECVWGRSGAVNILLPVNSDIYMDAVKETKVRNSALISLKDVEVGDNICLKNANAKITEGQYLGLYRAVSTNYIHEATEELFHIKKYYIVKGTDGIYYGFPSLKIYEITGRDPDAPKEKPDFIPIGKFEFGAGYGRAAFAIVAKAITAVTVSKTARYEKIAIDQAIAIMDGGEHAGNPLLFAIRDGNMYHGRSYQQPLSQKVDSSVFVGGSFTLDPETNKVSYHERFKSRHNIFSAIKTLEPVGEPIIDYEWMTMKVEINGKTFTVQ